MYRFYITIALLLTATIANQVFSAPEAELTRRPLSEFPKVIGDWRAINENKIDEGSMAVLQVDDYMMRTYTNKQEETIGLYIGYFEVQREGKGVHSPRQCLPGEGWEVIKYIEYQLCLKGHNPAVVPINLHLMGKGNQRQLYLWWYQGRGRIYANEYKTTLEKVETEGIPDDADHEMHEDYIEWSHWVEAAKKCKKEIALVQGFFSRD